MLYSFPKLSNTVPFLQERYINPCINHSKWFTNGLYEHYCALCNHVLIGNTVVESMLSAFRGASGKK